MYNIEILITTMNGRSQPFLIKISYDDIVLLTTFKIDEICFCDRSPIIKKTKEKFNFQKIIMNK